MIKKVFFICIAMILAHTARAQSYWEPENSTYENTKYGIFWVLPTNFNWQDVDLKNEAQIMRVADFDQLTCASIEVKYMGKQKSQNIWDYLTPFIQGFKSSHRQQEQQYPSMKYFDESYTKCFFAGQHAIRINWRCEIQDDRYGTVSSSCTSYSFLRDNNVFTIGLELPTTTYNDLGQDVSDFFKGFGFDLKK